MKCNEARMHPHKYHVDAFVRVCMRGGAGGRTEARRGRSRSASRRDRLNVDLHLL